MSELENAIRDNNMEKVELELIIRKLERDPIDYSEILKTLIYALKYERYDMFDFIVEQTNYDIDFRDDKFKYATLLMQNICYYGEMDPHSIRHILNRSKDVNIQDDDGHTALFKLIHKCDEYKEIGLSLIIEFLEKGANPLAGGYENTEEETALDLVILYEYFDILKIFVKHSKVDISFKALCMSIIEQNYNFVEYLLGHIKDVNAVDNNGRNLLQIANGCKHVPYDIIELLVESGAHD